MNILIIAFYYPPEESWAKVASLRPAAWAKYWSRLGHQVYVLTEYKSRLSTSNYAENVIGVEYWPSRSIKTISPVLETDTQNTNKDLKRKKSRTTIRSVIQTIRQGLRLGSFGQSSDFWLLPALVKAVQLQDSVNFDVVLSTYGPPANHIIAAALTRMRKLFWVADYRDLWFGNHFLQSNPILAIVENKIEQSCIKNAGFITTVSEGLAESLSSRFNVPVLTIENGFDLEDLPSTRIPMWSDQKKRLAYTGTIYWGKQEPTPLLEALKLLQQSRPRVHQELEILFYGWNLERLRELSQQYGVSRVIKIYEPRPREEILNIQASVDVLLFLDWSDSSTKGILTGKLFEYCFAGKPIIGIGSTAETSAGRLMLELGTGIPVGYSADQIVKILQVLLDDQPLPYAPNSQKMKRFTRENLAYEMLEGIIGEMNQQGLYSSLQQ